MLQDLDDDDATGVKSVLCVGLDQCPEAVCRIHRCPLYICDHVLIILSDAAHTYSETEANDSSSAIWQIASIPGCDRLV